MKSRHMRKLTSQCARTASRQQSRLVGEPRIVRSVAGSPRRRAKTLVRSLGLEVLETRALLSTVSLVTEINAVDLYPQDLTPAGTNLFYTIANSNNSGTELAVTSQAGSSVPELLLLAIV
jgi:hypothetical protein